MSALATRVSAVLRKAGLPMVRASEGMSARRGLTGIRVVGSGAMAGACSVVFRVYDDEDSPTNHATDEAAEWAQSDEAMAILIAAGFDVSRTPGINVLTVRNRPSGSVPVEDVQAVVESSGLDIVKLTHTEWHIEVDGQRSAYSIRRTGSGDRTRYAVHARKSGELARNLRTMSAAIEAVKQDLGKSA